MINAKVVIATHKKYEMPSDNIYLPLHVGKMDKPDLEYTGDNTGDNISDKNSSFCELTGLYWAWKNLSCDYLGLVHYRRYLSIRNKLYQMQHSRMNCVLNSAELETLVPKYQIILPEKRKYYIETLYSHYSHTHYKEQLDETRKIIEERYPQYLAAFDRTVNRRSGYMFNMYIMKKELSDSYCSWLFDILFELEKRISMPELSRYQGRFYGRVSEIIFNCWLEYQRKQEKIPIREIKCLHIEKINWLKKGEAFLKAKLYHRKYEESF